MSFHMVLWVWWGCVLGVSCTLLIIRPALPNVGFTDRPSLVQTHTHTNTPKTMGEVRSQTNKEETVVLQVRWQVLLHHAGIICRPVSLHHLSFFVYQKLCEIPFDVISQGSLAFGLCLHPLPKRVSLVSIHLNLTEEVKLGIVTFGKLFNICVSPRLLSSKLVAWEAHDA